MYAKKIKLPWGVYDRGRRNKRKGYYDSCVDEVKHESLLTVIPVICPQPQISTLYMRSQGGS